MSIIGNVREFFRPDPAALVPQVPKFVPDEPEAAPQIRASVTGGADWQSFIGGGDSLTVSAANITRITAYAAGVNVISQDLAKLPVHVMRREGKAKRQAVDHAVYKLLYLSPNPLMSSYVFRLTMFRHVLYRGNAFAQIQRTRGGKPIALYPLHPDSVSIRTAQDGAGLAVYYDVSPAQGKPVTLPASEIFHLKGDTEDGITGLSPIRQHALALGFALNTAEFGANFFKNGAHVSLAVVVPPDVADGDDDKQERFKAQFDGRHQGVARAGNVIYLEPGGDVKPVSITPEAAQYLDSRKFSRTEIAGLLRVPPHKIGDMDNSKYANLEEQNASYATDTLMPWAVQFEQECLLKLFSPEERDQYSVKFNFDAVLRGMTKERAEALRLQIMSGKMTINESRELDDQPPIDGGDQALVMTNMSTLGALAQNGGTPQAKDRAHWTVNERRKADGLEPLEGGDAIYMPATQIPAIEVVPEDGTENGGDGMEGM